MPKDWVAYVNRRGAEPSMTGADMLAAWLAEDKHNHRIGGVFWAGQWICEIELEDEEEMYRGTGSTVDAAMRDAVKKARGK